MIFVILGKAIWNLKRTLWLLQHNRTHNRTTHRFDDFFSTISTYMHANAGICLTCLRRAVYFKANSLRFHRFLINSIENHIEISKQITNYHLMIDTWNELQLFCLWRIIVSNFNPFWSHGKRQRNEMNAFAGPEHYSIARFGNVPYKIWKKKQNKSNKETTLKWPFRWNCTWKSMSKLKFQILAMCDVNVWTNKEIFEILCGTFSSFCGRLPIIFPPSPRIKWMMGVCVCVI